MKTFSMVIVALFLWGCQSYGHKHHHHGHSCKHKKQWECHKKKKSCKHKKSCVCKGKHSDAQHDHGGAGSLDKSREDAKSQSPGAGEQPGTQTKVKTGAEEKE